jgi:hypothetical protein
MAGGDEFRRYSAVNEVPSVRLVAQKTFFGVSSGLSYEARAPKKGRGTLGRVVAEVASGSELRTQNSEALALGRVTYCAHIHIKVRIMLLQYIFTYHL